MPYQTQPSSADHGAAWSAKSVAIIADESAPTLDTHGIACTGMSTYQVRTSDCHALLTDHVIAIYGYDGTDWRWLYTSPSLGAVGTQLEYELQGDYTRVCSVISMTGTKSLKRRERAI